MYVQDGQTALYIASRNGHGPVVRLLLQTEHTDVDFSQKVIKTQMLFMPTLPLAQQYSKTSVIQGAWDWTVAVTWKVCMCKSPACAFSFYMCMCTHGCNAGLIHVHANVYITNLNTKTAHY